MKKKLLLTFSILSILLVSFSCKKEKKPTELILGQYKLTAASVDGEDVLGLLQNDSLNFNMMYVSGEEGYYKLIFYILKNEGFDYLYDSRYKLINNYTVLQIKTLDWEVAPAYFLNNNLAILPFSQQEIINCNIINLTENELIFETTYSEKNYRYEFKK